MFPSEFKRVHFIAVGGAGMSGIAWVLLQRGMTVTGSDLAPNRMTQRLADNGADCFTGHSADHLNGVDLVVVSTAIAEDNCELREARRRGLPIWHRSQALSALMHEGRSIAITGSHGKTTATSMVGVLFEQAGCDPTVIVGGESANFGGTARAGQGDWIIAESDESDKSFLRVEPDYALITNVEADHLDHYADYAEVGAAFTQFIRQVRQPPVVCADDPGIREVVMGANRPVIRYSVTDSGADYCAADVEMSPHEVRFRLLRAGEDLGATGLSTPGLYNVSNALGALAVAIEAGLDPAVCRRALASYDGVQRRLTVRGKSNDVLIVDDYAHHPTEVRATLGVGRAWACERGGRLVCLFQPHRYTRTAALGTEFGPVFAEADQVIVTDVYGAGEAPIEGVTGALIADSVAEAGHPCVRYVAESDAAVDLLASELEPGDVLMTLGAGDIWQTGDRLRDRIERRTAEKA